MEIISNSDLDTQKIGYLLSKNLKGGEIICLYGNLGVGKTCLTNGIAKGLETKSRTSSPTFTIINEYDAVIPIYHFDVYRIGIEDFLEIGGEEYFYKKGVVIIEWPNNIESILPNERLDIKIEIDKKNINKRNLTFSAYGTKYEKIVNSMGGIVK